MGTMDMVYCTPKVIGEAIDIWRGGNGHFKYKIGDILKFGSDSVIKDESYDPESIAPLTPILKVRGTGTRSGRVEVFGEMIEAKIDSYIVEEMWGYEEYPPKTCSELKSVIEKFYRRVI